MFGDFLKALKERADNPIAGAFAISFVLFNWRMFSHLLLSDASVDVRLQAVDRLTDGCLILYVWGCPIVLALAYVMGMPWVSMLIEKQRQRGTDKLIEVKKSQDPRIAYIIRLKEKQWTVDDFLTRFVQFDIGRDEKNGKQKLDDAVNAFRHVIHQTFFKPELSPEENEKMKQGLGELNDAFNELLGTPLIEN